MVTKNPEIPKLRDQRLLEFGDSVFVSKALGPVGPEQPCQFLILEANEANVKVLMLQCGKLNTKQVFIPTGIQRKLVVGDDVRALLSLVEVIQNDYRNLGEPQSSRGEEPAMALSDSIAPVDEDRV